VTVSVAQNALRRGPFRAAWATCEAERKIG
jgi:hypothetical protein